MQYEGSRSSREKVFCEKGVLRNLTIIHRKTPVQKSLFNKVPGLRPATLLKRRLWHKCFLVNFVKSLRTLFYTEHLRWLFLRICEIYLNWNISLKTQHVSLVQCFAPHFVKAQQNLYTTGVITTIIKRTKIYVLQVL